MPISLPKGLPGRRLLAAEGVEVLDARQLSARGRRPLRICFVNLMPSKAATEAQFGRLLATTPVAIEIVPCLPDGYRSKSASPEHLAFYPTWSCIRDQRFDALIVTGAPVETRPFETVDYWPGLVAMLDWACREVLSSLYICWAAQAALHHFHGVQKRQLARKMFGVFPHQVLEPGAGLVRGFPGEFAAPVSRHTEIRAGELPAVVGLRILASSAEAGLCLVEDGTKRAVYMFNHLEYDAGTLRDEYLRDRDSGRAVEIPRGYFPGDDPSAAPPNTWRPFGHLLFANWLDGLARAARSLLDDEPMLQWMLAERRGPGREDGRYSDLLVEGAWSPDVVPMILRVIADQGVGVEIMKVHRHQPTGLLIELRLQALAAHPLERLAQRLCGCRNVSRIAFRSDGDSGGWYVAPRSADRAVSTPCIPTKAA